MTRSAAVSSRDSSTQKLGSLSSRPSASMRWARDRTASALNSENAAAVSSLMDQGSKPRSILIERPPNRMSEVFRLLLFRRIISGGLFGRYLDMSVSRDKLVGQRHALDDLDALGDERVVFHVAHRDEAVDAAQTKPMNDVGHQLLEPCVLDAGNAFGSFEIGARRIAAFLALAGVVDQKFCDLAQRTAFLAVIGDDAKAALLRAARAFDDAVDQVRPAGAAIGAKHVGAIALIVDAAGDFRARVGKLFDIADQIKRRAADRWQKYTQVGPGHELRGHVGGLFKQRPAQ